MKKPLLILTLALGAACSDGGPTAIEVPIASLEFTTVCSPLIEDTMCRPGVLATTAEGQAIANPILRWGTSNSTVLSVSNEGVVRAESAGRATVTVSNSTGTVSAMQEILVLPANDPK